MSTQVSDPKLKPQTKPLQPWKVILHNDSKNTAEFVLQKVVEIARLPNPVAEQKVVEAHTRGKSILLSTHKERAELIVERFDSCNISTTIEK